ncbi:hypothetical protein D3C87_1747460 [compost metagenome]
MPKSTELVRKVSGTRVCNWCASWRDDARMIPTTTTEFNITVWAYDLRIWFHCVVCTMVSVLVLYRFR